MKQQIVILRLRLLVKFPNFYLFTMYNLRFGGWVISLWDHTRTHDCANMVFNV